MYAKTFGRIFLDICFYDSQKKSDTKLLKIHLEMWFTFKNIVKMQKNAVKCRKRQFSNIKYVLKLSVKYCYTLGFMIHKKDLIQNY